MAHSNGGPSPRTTQRIPNYPTLSVVAVAAILGACGGDLQSDPSGSEGGANQGTSNKGGATMTMGQPPINYVGGSTNQGGKGPGSGGATMTMGLPPINYVAAGTPGSSAGAAGTVKGD